MQFDYPNVGGVYPSYDFKVVKLINYVTSRDFLRLGLEVTALHAGCSYG